MKKMLFLLLINSYVFSMDWRQVSEVQPYGHTALSIDIPPTPNSDDSDDSIILNSAMEEFSRTKKDRMPCLKSYIEKVIKEDKHSPAIDHARLSRSIARIRSGDVPQEGTDMSGLEYIKDILLRASQEAFADQHAHAQKNEERANRKVSKKSVAAITTLIGTLCTTITALVVNYNSKNC